MSESETIKMVLGDDLADVVAEATGPDAFEGSDWEDHAEKIIDLIFGVPPYMQNYGEVHARHNRDAELGLLIREVAKNYIIRVSANKAENSAHSNPHIQEMIEWAKEREAA